MFRMQRSITSALRRSVHALAAICIITSVQAGAGRPVDTGTAPLATTNPYFAVVERSGEHGTVVTLPREAITRAASGTGLVEIERFPLTADQFVDLRLEPFNVTTDRTRFVVGRLDGPDVPFDFDPASVQLLRGKVVGHPESDVFFAVSDKLTTARITLGPDEATYRLSTRLTRGVALPAGQAVVFQSSAGAAPGIGVPECGVDHLDGHSIAEPVGTIAAVATSTVGMRTIELAVDTDYEYFELFGNLDDAAAYTTAMYGAVSSVYMRDINARYELTYVRLWDDPNDLYNDPSGNAPLFDFQDYWDLNMGAVHRDLAQFMSGRRDFGFGGVAYLSAACTSYGYSVIAYVLGYFPNLDEPSSYQFDVSVAAHELGHNCSAQHTPNYTPPIDLCYPAPTVPQRGTIMSYCGQTVSGGNSVMDLRFHARIKAYMLSYLIGTSCVDVDCNMNGVADALDIGGGASPDTNGNAIPDECEDCNGNGVLDTIDLAGGSLDINGNGLPDECEPDCNGNGIPDDRDLLLGTSPDAYGNNVPDECERDCNANGISDYTEIQANLALDINRNLWLDACEDCDGDGTLDAEALNGAHNAWITSDTLNLVGEFHADTGVLVKYAEADRLSAPQDVVITATGRILVSSALDDRVVEFDRSGAYVGDFVTAGSGGLDYPTGLAIGPDGHLYVSSRGTSSVLRYDGASGAYLGVLVSSGDGGLVAPYGIAFGTGVHSGSVFIASGDGKVVEYDAPTGGAIGTFTNGGPLPDPRSLLFNTDGTLLVTDFSGGTVRAYAADGTYIGDFQNGGTLLKPRGIRFAPNGSIVVTRDWVLPNATTANESEPDIARNHVTSSRAYEYDAANGNLLRSYVVGNDTGLYSPTGIAFMPGDDVDCNVNFKPDACDIASGASQDCNANSVPDSCDIARGTEPDLNGDGVPDVCNACAPSSAPIAEMRANNAGIQVINVKNRWLSFSSPDTGRIQAARVTFVDLPGTYAVLNGQTMWAGQPFLASENGSSKPPIPGFPDFAAAELQCDPAEANFSAFGIIHVTGEAIVPGGTYRVELVDAACDLNDESAYSAPLTLTAGRWGDSVGSFDTVTLSWTAADNSVDVATDIVAALDKFGSAPTSPTKPMIDLEPALVDYKINVTDVTVVLDAFGGGSYPFTSSGDPCP